ncbi:MAG: hydroxymethylbilane synthase [Solirubrobacterales bacterium]
MRLGTRGSALALAQASWVAGELRAAGAAETELVTIATSGDRGAPVGDKSRFVREIEQALTAGEIDLAVHSAKDLPGELPEDLVIAGAPAAEDARDALVGAGSLEELREGARVGSSSLRRQSLLLAHRPDLEIVALRGNVDTRLGKLAEGTYDAIVLALAGLRRLGREAEAGAALDPERFVPAPGQGILALEARIDDGAARAAAESITDTDARVRLTAERAVVAALDANCDTPVGAHARVNDERLELIAYAGSPDGRDWITDRIERPLAGPTAVGDELAQRMLAAGAKQILGRK